MLTEKRFDTGELTLAYLDSETDAPPLVLLHGLTGWRADWRHFASLLTPNWRVYVVELRGHGNSDRGESYRLVDYGRDIIAFLKNLGQPVVLVGFSLGALIALTVASQYPAGVRALIPIDPPLFAGTSPAQSIGDYFGWVYEMMKVNPSYETVVSQVAATYPQDTDAGVIMAMADQLSRVAPGTIGTVLEGQLWNSADLIPILQSIQPPTLMIYGDAAMGAAVSDEAVALFKQALPSAQIVNVSDVGHLIPIERPQQVLESLNAFLASL